MSTLSSTKLVRLLQTFDEAELKAFDAWLRSPWCNTNKNLIRLLERLRRYHPAFDDRRLTKEELFRQVLPDGKFSDRRLNNLMSEGYLAAERFLTFQRFAHHNHLQKGLLAEELQARHLDDWFFKVIDQETDRLEAEEKRNLEAHLSLFRLYRLTYHHPTQDTRMQPGASAIEKMDRQIDLLYALEKAAILNEKMVRSRLIRGEHYETETELKKWKTVSSGLQHPAIDLYRLRFAYGEENRFEQYRVLRQALLNDMARLSEQEQKLHFFSLLNDTMAFIKSGKLDITDSLPLYRLGLETGVLLHQGKLTRNTFTTIVTAGNTRGDFEFTTRFIETYTPRVDASIRDDCRHWALAHTTYWEKDLMSCLDILQRHTFKTSYFQLVSRVLGTQAYFDLFLADTSYQSYLFSFFDTFEKWLQREKVWSKRARASFLRFVQKCRTLARYHAGMDPDARKVEQLLENEPDVQALNWLKSKREEVLRLKPGGELVG